MPRTRQKYLCIITPAYKQIRSSQETLLSYKSFQFSPHAARTEIRFQIAMIATNPPGEWLPCCASLQRSLYTRVWRQLLQDWGAKFPLHFPSPFLLPPCLSSYPPFYPFIPPVRPSPANFLENVIVKELWKSASLLTKLCVDYAGLLFWPTLYIAGSRNVLLQLLAGSFNIISFYYTLSARKVVSAQTIRPTIRTDI